MVAEQRETVQRIDADTLDIASNVMDGQRELLKYFGNMASNRWLMLKVFGVLIVFVSALVYRHSIVFSSFYSSWYLFWFRDEGRTLNLLDYRTLKQLSLHRSRQIHNNVYNRGTAGN